MQKKHQSSKKWLKRLRRLVALSLLLFACCWWLIPLSFDIPELNTATPDESRILLDRDGIPLHHSTRSDYVRNRRAALADIPPSLIQATLAAEDKRFWDHHGIDFLATARSLKDSLQAQRFVSGASTITQQTVKLTHSPSKRSISTKIKEAFQARHMEMKYSKNQILALYFNNIDYGNRTQGPKQAAKHYFNKELSQLSLAETALLAGLPQAPTRHNPRKNPKGAIARRNWILDRMAIVFQIDKKQIDRAKQEALSLYRLSDHQGASELAELFSPTEEKTITTTLSKPLYTKIKSITRQELEKLKNHNVNNAAVVVIHNATGEIRCLLGSPHFHSPLGGQYNAALIPRSPGSALKPFVYLMGFEHRGLTPATIIPDIPTYYPGERGVETFVNYDRSFRGPVTISRALGNSLNIPAVRVLNQSGGPVALQSYLKKFGFKSLQESASNYGLSLAIGGGEVTLLEITNAYATLARLGQYQPATLIKRASQKQQIADSTQCYLIAQIMADNHARSMSFGSHSALRLPFPCAVKTGTSTDYKDNFCIGFTKDYTVGVWVGNIDQSPMQKISGVTGAGSVFQDTMLALHEESTPTWFKKPAQIHQHSIDPHTGKLLTSDHPRYPLAQQISLSSTPEEALDSDYNHLNQPILDQRYQQWMKTSTASFALSESTKTIRRTVSFKILSPSKNATYLLDPDLPNNGNTLKLEANQSNVTWHCDTLTIENNKATLTEGTHIFTASSPQSNDPQTVQIQVKAL